MLPERGLPQHMLSLAELQQPLSAQTAAAGFAGLQTGGWPCLPSPLCVQLWCCNEIDAFPQIIFPWKQSQWLLWRSYWWIGGSNLGECFRNTCPIHEHKAKFTTWNSVKCCPLGPYSWCAELNPESGEGVRQRIKTLPLTNSAFKTPPPSVYTQQMASGCHLLHQNWLHKLTAL